MLAFHWELELRLSDLDLPADEVRQILQAFQGSNAGDIAAAQRKIKQSMLRAAGATKGDVPDRSEGDTDFYPDGTRITGSAKLGKVVYESACAGCHGSVNSLAGRALIMDDKRFHFYTRSGTERDGLYMPLFTTQRLSRPQIADVRAYLRSLPR
jgi:mono/diheme cytochrome c family protein